MAMTPARFLNRAEAQLRFGALADSYAAALRQADPLADAAIEAMHVFHGRWWPMTLRALEQGIDSVEDAPAELRTLLASLPPPPSEQEWRWMEAGSAALARTGESAGLALQCAALMVDYWSPPFTKPLLLTGNLMQHTAHRMAQTGAWWIELHAPRGLRPDHDGYKTTLHVRMVHSFVRRMALHSGVWDGAAWGAPINQGDLFFQVVGFTKLMLDSLERMGYAFTADEKEGYYAFWRHVSALLGIEAGLLPLVNQADCGRFWDLWMLANPGPDADGIALAGQTLTALAELGTKSPARRGLQLAFLRGATRWLLGPEICDGLQVPRSLIGDLLPVFYRPAVRLSEGIVRLSGGNREHAVARAIHKLATGNALVGVLPKGTEVVSPPERLEALAKFKPLPPSGE
jgi:hypothetical protein